jgi:hypothetical protein
MDPILRGISLKSNEKAAPFARFDIMRSAIIPAPTYNRTEQGARI